jgi:phosphoglycolate phosphatase
MDSRRSARLALAESYQTVVGWNKAAGETTMRFSLLIWDFDGTLADSLALALELFNRSSAVWGYRPVTDVEAVRHLSARQFMRQHGISWWRLPRLVRYFHAEAAAYASQLRLYPPVAEMLPPLREAGLRFGILSSNSEANIRATLRANGQEEAFEFIASCPRLFRKGSALRRLVRRLDVPRERILYLGDEVRDITAARKAGVAIAAVSWGFHALPVLRAAQPDFLLTHPHQLWDVLAAVPASAERAPGVSPGAARLPSPAA